MAQRRTTPGGSDDAQVVPTQASIWEAMEEKGFRQDILSDGTTNVYLPSGTLLAQIPADAPYLQQDDDGQGWNEIQLDLRRRHASAMAVHSGTDVLHHLHHSDPPQEPDHPMFEHSSPEVDNTPSSDQ
jgi:hypothetical protein